MASSSTLASSSAAEPHNKHSTSKHTKIYCATVLPGNNHQLLLDALGRRPWWRTSEDKGAASFDLWWGGNGQPFDWAGGGIGKGCGKLINKMSVHSEICVKARLAHNLRRYARTAKVDLSSLVPVSFVLMGGKGVEQLNELSAFRDACASAAARGEKLWIVKPGSGNRGHGIKLCSSAKAVEAHLRDGKAGAPFVVQKYIERPLLVGRRKFDMRQFVLVTHDLRVRSLSNTRPPPSLLSSIRACTSCDLIEPRVCPSCRRCSCTRTATCAHALARTMRRVQTTSRSI